MSQTLRDHRIINPNDFRSDSEIIFELGTGEPGDLRRLRDPEFDKEFGDVRDKNRPGMIESVSKGIGRGIDTTQALGFGVVGLAGDALGIEALRDFGIEGYQRNIREAEKNKAFTHFRDIEGIADFTDWALGGLGELTPNVLTTIVAAAGTGGAGAVFAAGGKKAVQKKIGDQLLKKFRKEELNKMTQKQLASESDQILGIVLRREIAKSPTGITAKAAGEKQLARQFKEAAVSKGIRKGSEIGAVGSSVALNTGETFGQFADELDNPNISRAERVFSSLGFGGLAGLLDSALPLVAVRALSRGARDSIIDTAVSNIKAFAKDNPVSAAALTLAGGTVTEGTTEAIQELLSYLALTTSDEDKPFDWDEIKPQLIEAGALGALGGGVFGGAAAVGAIKSNKGPDAKKRAENIKSNHTFLDQEAEKRGEDVKARQEERAQPPADTQALFDIINLQGAIDIVGTRETLTPEQDNMLEEIKGKSSQGTAAEIDLLRKGADQKRIQTLQNKVRDETIKDDEVTELKLLEDRHPEFAVEIKVDKGTERYIALVEKNDTLGLDKDEKKEINKLAKKNVDTANDIIALRQLIATESILTIKENELLSKLTDKYPGIARGEQGKLVEARQEAETMRQELAEKKPTANSLKGMSRTQLLALNDIFFEPGKARASKKDLITALVEGRKFELTPLPELTTSTSLVTSSGDETLLNNLKSIEILSSTIDDQVELKKLQELKDVMTLEAKKRGLKIAEGAGLAELANQTNKPLEGEAATADQRVTNTQAALRENDVNLSAADANFVQSGALPETVHSEEIAPNTELDTSTLPETQKVAGKPVPQRVIVVKKPDGSFEGRAVFFDRGKWRVSSGLTRPQALLAVAREYGVGVADNTNISESEQKIMDQLKKDLTAAKTDNQMVAAMSKAAKKSPDFAADLDILMHRSGFDPNSMIGNRKKTLEDFYNESTPVAWLTPTTQVDTNFVWRGNKDNFDLSTEKSRLMVEETKKGVSENNQLYLALQRLADMEVKDLVSKENLSQEEAEANVLNRGEENRLIQEDGLPKEQAFLQTVNTKWSTFFDNMVAFTNKAFRENRREEMTDEQAQQFINGMLNTSSDFGTYFRSLQTAKTPTDVLFQVDDKVLGLFTDGQIERLSDAESEQEFIQLATEFTSDLVQKGDSNPLKRVSSRLAGVVANGANLNVSPVEENTIGSGIEEAVVAEEIVVIDEQGFLNEGIYDEISRIINTLIADGNPASITDAITEWLTLNGLDPEVIQLQINIGMEMMDARIDTINSEQADFDASSEKLKPLLNNDEALAEINEIIITELSNAYEQTTIKLGDRPSSVAESSTNTKNELLEPTGVESGQTTSGTTGEPIGNKDKVNRVTRLNFKAIIRGVFNLTDEQADILANIVDGIATSWAFRNARTAEEWYTTFIEDVQSLPDAVREQISTNSQKISRSQEETSRGARGMIEFIDNGKALITAFQNADATTAIHELFHLIRRTGLSDDQLVVLEEWLGVENGFWTVAQEEKAAAAYETYLKNGKAPNSNVRGVFDSIAKWFKEAYNVMKGGTLNDTGTIPSNVISVFDQITAGIPDAPPGGAKASTDQAITPEGAESTSTERENDQPFAADSDRYPDVLDVEGDVNIQNEALGLAKSQGVSPGSKPLKYIIRDQGKVVAAIFRSVDSGNYVFDIVVHEEYKSAGNEQQLLQAAKDEWAEQTQAPNIIANVVDPTIITALQEEGFNGRDNTTYYVLPRVPDVLFQADNDVKTEALDGFEPSIETLRTKDGNVADSPMPDSVNAINHANRIRSQTVEYEDAQNIGTDKSNETVTNERHMAFNKDILEFATSLSDQFKFLTSTRIIQMIPRFNPVRDIEYLLSIAPEVANADVTNLNPADKVRVHRNLWMKYSEIRNMFSKRKDQKQSDLENSRQEHAELRKGLNLIISDINNLDGYNASAKEYAQLMLEILTIDPNLNNGSAKMNMVIKQLEELQGRDPEIVPDNYLAVLEKFTDQRTGIRLDDVLMSVSSLGLDWENVSIKEALNAINNFQTNPVYRETLRGGNADDVRNGFLLMQRDPELRAFAVTYASTHALETKILQARVKPNKDELNKAQSDIDDVAKMNPDEVSEARLSLQRDPLQNDIHHKIKQLMLDYQHKFNQLEKLLPNLELEIADLELAIEAAKQKFNASAAVVGGTKSFNGKPGETYLIMNPEMGIDQDPGEADFNYEGENADAWKHVDDNRRWVDENQDNPDIDPQLLNQIKKQNDVMQYSLISKQEAHNVKQPGWLIALESVQQFFADIGFVEGIRISQMFLGLQRTINEGTHAFRPLAQKWERAEGELRKSAGYKSAQRFKLDVMIQVYAHLESLEGVVNDRTALNSGYEVFLQRLRETNPELPINQDKLRDHFDAYILRTKELSTKLNLEREKSGIAIQDQKGERLKAIDIGWLTLPRFMKTGKIGYLVSRMSDTGWLSSQFSEDGTPQGWWLDSEGNHIVDVIMENDQTTPKKKIELLQAVYAEKLSGIATTSDGQEINFQEEFVMPIVNHDIPLFEGVTRVEIQDAWEQSRDAQGQGDAVTFAQIMASKSYVGRAQEDQVAQYLKVFTNQFRNYAGISDEAGKQSSWIDVKTGNHFMSDARMTSAIPSEYVDYADFDKGSVNRQVMKLASMKHFGKDFGTLTSVFDSMNQRLATLAEEAHKKEDFKKERELRLKISRADKKLKKYIRWYSGSEDSANQETGFWSTFLRL